MAATPEDILTNHVPYEVRMMRATFLRLEGWNLEGDRVLANACIEAFSLHARNLLEFFEKDKSSNYATARWFVEGYRPLSKPVVRKKLLAKLNTQLMHLTWERTSVASEKLGAQDRRELVEVLRRELSHFVKQLTSDYKHLWPVDVVLPSVPLERVASSATNTIHTLTSKTD